MSTTPEIIIIIFHSSFPTFYEKLEKKKTKFVIAEENVDERCCGYEVVIHL